MADDELVVGHLAELRRGTIVLACLLVLRRPNYGYALLDELERRGFTVDANTLYPLLRRLERQGLLVGEWNTDESRPRKFYQTSEEGERIAALLLADWTDLTSAFDALRGET